MPRLPVIVTALATVLVMAPMPFKASAAEQRMLIRYAFQLDDDKDVKTFVEPYRVLSSANVVFDKCMKEWLLSDEQRAYLPEKFDTVSRDYLNAYINAYTKRVGGGMPPGQEMVDEFAKHIVEQQRKAVDIIAKTIHKQGCQAGPVRKTLIDLEALRQADLQPKPAPKPLKD